MQYNQVTLPTKITAFIKPSNLFLRHIALPSEYGSWVFLLSPLLIGLFTSGTFNIPSIFLIIAALAAFLIRQPITIAVKVYSGRRSPRDLPAAWFWIATYGLIGLIAIIGLVFQGFAYLFILALPGVPVFIWHLYLISKRAERRRVGVEIVGSGVLALTAPAGYWIGVGSLERVGWLLLILAWLQSAASIVYAYLRLAQRELDAIPDIVDRVRMGSRALLYTSFNILLVTVLSIINLVSPYLIISYALQWIETLWGTLDPAVGMRPTNIGIRQLIVSSLFTLLFILTW